MMKIKVPSKVTLRKYGMSEQDYLDIIERQGGVCPICKRFPKDGKFVIDHYHHKNYKKLPDYIRKMFVRGCLCWYDNYFLMPKGITLERAENMVKYLKDFEDRRPK